MSQPTETLDANLSAIVEYVADWYSDEPIDWHDAIDRVESVFKLDMGNDMNSADIRKIKRLVNQARREG